MKNWKKVVIKPTDSIIFAAKVLEETALQIALVLDDAGVLLGTVTDGDIRSAMLNNIPLTAQVSSIMFTKPSTANQGESRESVLAIMQGKNIFQIPIVDDYGRVVELEIFKNLVKPVRRDNLVVIMAGGMGVRLRPLTDDCPKPMLKIGEKPILQNIIESCMSHGFHKFFITLNYRAEAIETFFGHGEKWGVSIDYIREEKRLGTAGALSFFEERPKEPIIVMNGDILTKINFAQLVDFHVNEESNATMCIREYSYQIPYGVINFTESSLLSIIEKPVKSLYVNAGIYVLNPKTLDYIPYKDYFDMPSLFKMIIEKGEKSTVFPVREYWLDIGSPADFEKANDDHRQGNIR